MNKSSRVVIAALRIRIDASLAQDATDWIQNDPRIRDVGRHTAALSVISSEETYIKVIKCKIVGRELHAFYSGVIFSHEPSASMPILALFLNSDRYYPLQFHQNYTLVMPLM